MAEYFDNHRRIFDRGDDLQGTVAVGAVLDVEVYIVNSTQASSGIGEPSVPPLAPAIGNAIFAATGNRLRSLPSDIEA